MNLLMVSYVPRKEDFYETNPGRTLSILHNDMEEGALRYDIFEFDLLYKGTKIEIIQNVTSPNGHDFSIGIDYFGDVGIPPDKIDSYMNVSAFSDRFG